jgi:acyl carrier protein
MRLAGCDDSLLSKQLRDVPDEERGERVGGDGVTRAECEARIRAALAEVLPDDDIAAVPGDANLAETLDIDSLSLVDFLLELERETGLRIPDEDLGRLTTIDAIVDYVTERQPSAA